MPGRTYHRPSNRSDITLMTCQQNLHLCSSECYLRYKTSHLQPSSSRRSIRNQRPKSVKDLVTTSPYACTRPCPPSTRMHPAYYGKTREAHAIPKALLLDFQLYS